MATSVPTKENEAIVRRFADEFINGSDYDTADEFLAEDVHDYTPMGETTGRDAVVATAKMMDTAFPDFSITIEDVVVDGDTVAVRMTQRGTHDGVFMGIEPTGKSFEIEAMGFARLADGKITERRARPDVIGLLRQLGITDIPTPEP